MQLLVQLVAVVRRTVLGVVVDHDPNLSGTVRLLVRVVKLSDVPETGGETERRRDGEEEVGEKIREEEEEEEGEKERKEERRREGEEEREEDLY